MYLPQVLNKKNLWIKCDFGRTIGRRGEELLTKTWESVIPVSNRNSVCLCVCLSDVSGWCFGKSLVTVLKGTVALTPSLCQSGHPKFNPTEAPYSPAPPVRAKVTLFFLHLSVCSRLSRICGRSRCILQQHVQETHKNQSIQDGDRSCTLTHIPVQPFPILQAAASRVLRHTACEMQLSSIPALLSSVQLYAASTHTHTLPSQSLLFYH